MYGAILGDMIGSPYEFDMGNKSKEFPLFSKNSTFTDDTVMTIAVAAAFLDAQPDAEPQWTRNRLIKGMQRYGKAFPYAGYGGMFRRWLRAKDPQPYGSYGNGSAMRVSAVAWLYNDLDTVRSMARLSAEVTHNHPEGIKGAEATASAIFLARTGVPSQKSRHTSKTSLVMNSAALVMRFGPTITMWSPVRKPSRKLSPHFWRANPSRM